MGSAFVVDLTHAIARSGFEHGRAESKIPDRDAPVRRFLPGGPLDNDLAWRVADRDVRNCAALQIDNRDIVGLFIRSERGFAVRPAGNPVRPGADFNGGLNAVCLGIENGQKARALNRGKAAFAVRSEVGVVGRDAYLDFANDFVAGGVRNGFAPGLGDIQASSARIELQTAGSLFERHGIGDPARLRSIIASENLPGACEPT